MAEKTKDEMLTELKALQAENEQLKAEQEDALAEIERINGLLENEQARPKAKISPTFKLDKTTYKVLYGGKAAVKVLPVLDAKGKVQYAENGQVITHKVAIPAFTPAEVVENEDLQRLLLQINFGGIVPA